MDLNAEERVVAEGVVIATDNIFQGTAIGIGALTPDIPPGAERFERGSRRHANVENQQERDHEIDYQTIEVIPASADILHRRGL